MTETIAAPEKKDLEVLIEDLVQDARAMKLRVDFLKITTNKLAELGEENQQLRHECDELQLPFVESVVAMSLQDQVVFAERLVEIYTHDFEKLKTALGIQAPDSAASSDSESDTSES